MKSIILLALVLGFISAQNCTRDYECEISYCCLYKQCSVNPCDKSDGYPEGHYCEYDYQCKDHYCSSTNQCAAPLPLDSQCDTMLDCHSGCCHSNKCSESCADGEPCLSDSACLSFVCNEHRRCVGPFPKSILTWYWILLIVLAGIVFLVLLISCILKVLKQRNQKLKRVAARRFKSALFLREQRMTQAESGHHPFINEEPQINNSMKEPVIDDQFLTNRNK